MDLEQLLLRRRSCRTSSRRLPWLRLLRLLRRLRRLLRRLRRLLRRRSRHSRRRDRAGVATRRRVRVRYRGAGDLAVT